MKQYGQEEEKVLWWPVMEVSMMDGYFARTRKTRAPRRIRSLALQLCFWPERTTHPSKCIQQDCLKGSTMLDCIQQ